MDIFISYRRENSEFIAQLIYDKLTNDGYSVFLDVKTLASGKFDDALLNRIENCNDFLLILSKGSLDRCQNEDDWLKTEIENAIKLGKNIIPIMTEDFIEFPKNIPSEIKEISHFNALELHASLVDEMILKLKKSYLKSNPKKPKNQPKESVKIATSNLTVIDAIIQGWDLERILNAQNFTAEEYSYAWSNLILDDLNSGKIDIAIYNKEETLKYKEKTGSKIAILRDICSSMGGRNFYILASKAGKYKNMSLEEFRENLDESTMIAVPKSSDMYRNLLYILDMSEDELLNKGVKIIDSSDNFSLSVFEINPNLLLIGGQNLRFLAEFKGGFVEVISYDDFPKEKREFFFKNSVNSLLISPQALLKFKDIDLQKFSHDLLSSFYANFLCEIKAAKIRTKLAMKIRNSCENNEQMSEYIIKKIIFETYRL